MELTEKWGTVLDRLQGRLSEEMFNRWFAATSLAEDSGTELTVEIPNPIHEFWIESNFFQPLQASVVEALQSPRAISFRVREQDRAVDAGAGNQLEAPVLSPMEEPRREEKPASGPKLVQHTRADKEAKWRGKTFDSFVIGKNNQYASGAAMAVAKRPGETYNPLFIHGGAGLGKTHLLRAIGNHILQENPKAKVIYVTSEDFMNAYIEALRVGEMAKFRRRFRRADAL